MKAKYYKRLADSVRDLAPKLSSGDFARVVYVLSNFYNEEDPDFSSKDFVRACNAPEYEPEWDHCDF